MPGSIGALNAIFSISSLASLSTIVTGRNFALCLSSALERSISSGDKLISFDRRSKIKSISPASSATIVIL